MFIVFWELVRRHAMIDCVHRPGAGPSFSARQCPSPNGKMRHFEAGSDSPAARRSDPRLQETGRSFRTRRKKYAAQKAGMAFCAAHLYFFAEQWSCRSPLHLSCRAGHSKSFGCRHLQTAGDRLLLYRPHRLSLSPPTKNFGAFSTFSLLAAPGRGQLFSVLSDFFPVHSGTAQRRGKAVP